MAAGFSLKPKAWAPMGRRKSSCIAALMATAAGLVLAGCASDVESEIEQVEAEAENQRKDKLLDTLLAMSPKAFEKLAQRLLRESGFSTPGACSVGRSSKS